MLESLEPSTSKAGKLNNSSNDVENSEIEMGDMDCNEDISSIWCIEDDTLFYAQGLKHHTAGKGKSVYVTWNENYLLNFVFKTSSKTGTTSLTKVRIAMPAHENQLEEISDILILEMNTLIYMKSGRIYYFSSVKSMHKVDWLSGIRCLTYCPLTQFSVIRLLETSDPDGQDRKKILSLEVYKDVPQLGKCFSNDVLMRSYDISFDWENLFNCDWVDETYTLTSLLTDGRNIQFLKQLLSIGNIFLTQKEVVDLNMNQEIHIFTVSGNIFLLVGAVDSEGEFSPKVRNFSIRLLNTYACPIECIRIDCKRNLLIVLLQSGHMDIWYKSKQTFGAFLHCHHEVSDFLNYDFCPINDIFYFTTPEEVIQLKIITCIDDEKECVVKETRKTIGGMIACTFVDGLQQLICLSINNIFYRINFTTLPEAMEISNVNETKYENLNSIYALSDKRIMDLLARSQIVAELIQQPKYFHNAIEKEFRNQQILALQSKSEIFKKLFQCHLEYHVCLPELKYFDSDFVRIKTNYQSQLLDSQSIFCLIFMSLKKNTNNFLQSFFTATVWNVHISDQEICLQLYIPEQILNKKLCFIVTIPAKNQAKQRFPKISLSLLTFFKHRYHSVCFKYNLDLDINEKTYVNLFSSSLQNFHIVHKLFDVKNLIRKESKFLSASKNGTKCIDHIYKLKQHCKLSRNVLQNIMEKLVMFSSWSLDMKFTIYFLYQHLVELHYDESKEILHINANCPESIYYVKLLLIHAMQSCNDVTIVDTTNQNMQQMIMNYQNDIEQLYGSLITVEPDDVNCNTIPMQLEILRNVYIKLRMEFCDILR